MKKRISCVLFLLLLVFSFFVSCSQTMNENDSLGDTLRFSADTMAERTVWTKEIEGNVLKDEVSGPEGFYSSISADTNIMFLSNKTSERVYPFVEGMGSLDIRSADKNAHDKLINFCDAFIKGENFESYVQREYLYSLIVFLYETGNDSKYNWYSIGEPFVTETLHQFPVRFFISRNEKETKTQVKKIYNTPHIDTMIYLKKEGTSWNIFQIDLLEK